MIPDTQNYVSSTTLHTTVGAQTRWIVENRNALNTVFTVHLGDIVDSWPNVNQWNRADQHLRVLDEARMPYAVVLGNHDLDYNTGNAPTFDQYFPPSRFQALSAGWQGASYGGYEGDSRHGPDPVNRLNKDNYALLTAGGLDLLLIQLEFEAPPAQH